MEESLYLKTPRERPAFCPIFPTKFSPLSKEKSYHSNNINCLFACIVKTNLKFCHLIEITAHTFYSFFGPKMNQSVEKAGVAFVKRANERN